MKTIKKFSMLVLMVPIMLSSCDYDSLFPSDNVTTIERDISGYTRLEVSHAFDAEVEFVESNEYISIVANENLHPYIEMELRNNKLTIKLANNARIKGKPTLRVYVHVQYLDEIEASGATKIKVLSPLVAENAKITVSGASQFTGEITATTLKVDVSGASKAWIEGHAKSLNATVSGASKFNDYQLVSEQAKIDVSGASTAFITATTSLQADVSGASKLFYKGNPVVDQSISGSSSIQRMN